VSTVLCRAHPSLALIKYWGKSDRRRNLPATPSLAVTLAGVHTETRVRPAEADCVVLDGAEQPPERYAAFFAALRRRLRTPLRFRADSTNSFPTAAGLASSSSGFAALAAACARAAGRELAAGELSALARIGSASAARSLFGGFTLLPARARAARQVFDESHWPELRVLVVVTSEEAKPLSSRQAMEATRLGSPFYRAWLASSGSLLAEAVAALRRRDLQRLGEAARLSYSRMHAALLACEPPVLYWLPDTLALVRQCAQLRRGGLGAWETIDAGPQVKVLCLAAEAAQIAAGLQEAAVAAAGGARAAGLRILECRPGPAPEVRVEGE
jgi:diphosphomevalonate decarboxylase